MKKIIAVLLAVCIFALPAVQISALNAGLTAQEGEIIYTDNDFGEMVVRIQLRLRELGYLSYKPTGVYRSMTTAAVKEFQSRCNAVGDEMIAVDGRLGPVTLEKLFDSNAPRPKIPDSVNMPRGPKNPELKEKDGALIEWETVKEKLKKGNAYRIIDCNTGRIFEMIFTGGENHAEMEIATVHDMENFKYICGDDYNFLKRPVIVEIEGERIAASIQCWPHGNDSISENGMSGHVCVFFKGSLSHVGMLPDVEHNANVFAAAGH